MARYIVATWQHMRTGVRAIQNQRERDSRRTTHIAPLHSQRSMSRRGVSFCLLLSQTHPSVPEYTCCFKPDAICLKAWWCGRALASCLYRIVKHDPFSMSFWTWRPFDCWDGNSKHASHGRHEFEITTWFAIYDKPAMLLLFMYSP